MEIHYFRSSSQTAFPSLTRTLKPRPKLCSTRKKPASINKFFREPANRLCPKSRYRTCFSVQPLCLCVSVVKDCSEKQLQRHRDTEVAQRKSGFWANPANPKKINENLVG